jgi:23S rRNA (guanosine2251-2'-O)-methyltransferase
MKRIHSKNHTPYYKDKAPDRYWLWGKHVCLSAISNPNRNFFRILVTRNALKDLPQLHGFKKVEETDIKDISKLLPKDAVHQGIAIEVAPLADISIEQLAHDKNIVVMDQVTDPHNIGAVLRSAAAFDIGALITTARHAPHETATLAKSASGALEIIPIIKVTNLSNTLEELKEHGYFCVGLSGDAQHSLTSLKPTKNQPIALVMGAEGKGLRQRTRETCDQLVRIPMKEEMESLNVSNAAAICFFHLMTQS